MLFVNSNVLPELQPHHIETAYLRKRAKHFLKCKEGGEGVATLVKGVLTQSSRETSCPSNRQGKSTFHQRRSYDTSGRKEQGQIKWPLGIVENHIVGTDGIVRGAVLRSGKSRFERAVQHLYPLELSCDRLRPHLAELNPQAQPF